MGRRRLDAEETADLAVRLKAAGADYIHVSSGGVSPQQRIALGPEYKYRLRVW